MFAARGGFLYQGTNVPGGWDISTLTYSTSYDGSTQDNNNLGIFFKDDGTKMYILGAQNDRVYEYDLSTAFDVSSASYVQQLTVSSQDNDPYGLYFKPDGTKLYIVGNQNNNVYQYNLSSAWNLSTATYNQSFSVGTQDATPTDVFFKTDGTKMYISGNINDSVFEYNLSSAWDISTATYNQSFSVGSQDATPLGVYFNPNGLQMFIIGIINDNVYQYNLSNAWDISTATYIQSKSVASQTTFPRGLYFKDDGTMMFTTGGSSGNVYSYTL